MQQRLRDVGANQDPLLAAAAQTLFEVLLQVRCWACWRVGGVVCSARAKGRMGRARASSCGSLLTPCAWPCPPQGIAEEVPASRGSGTAGELALGVVASRAGWQKMPTRIS